jgi:hypothetical protein
MFETFSQSPSLIKDVVLAIDAIVDSSAFDWVLYGGSLLGFTAFLISKSTSYGRSKDQGLQGLVIALLIFIVGAESEADLAIINPVTAEAYVVTDVPGGIALVTWGTSAVGKTFYDLYRMQMVPAGMTDSLVSEGVGRGLSVLTGIQNVPWTDETRRYGNTGSNFTDIESSINNYLIDCFNVMQTRDAQTSDAWSVLHKRGDSSGIAQIWARVQAPIVMTTQTYINAATAGGTSETCSDAFDSIGAVITSSGFAAALFNDYKHNMAKHTAAMSSPGASATLDPTTTTSTVVAKIEADASAMLTALFGGTTDAAKILMLDRLNKMLLDAFKASPRAQVEDPVGRVASAWDDAKRQSDLSMAAKGDFWSRNAKPLSQFLELIALAMLPILLFLAFVSPQGITSILSLVGVYFWIQTWPIAYIIINSAAIGSMANMFSLYLQSTNTLGMEDMYGLFDQARHSYAVSQMLLGMTPLITGAMLGGSMMALTRLAGDLGSTENLDEKRVYSDTEDSAPVFSRSSQTSFQTDSNGMVIRNEDKTGTGTDINLSQRASESVSAAEGQRATATASYDKAWQSTMGRVIQNSDTQTLQNVVSQAKGYDEGFQSQAITADAQMQSTATQYVDKNAASLSADIGARMGGRLKPEDSKALKKAEQDSDSKERKALGEMARTGSIDAGIKAGMSKEASLAFIQQYQESEEFRTALSQHLKGSDSFQDQDTFQKVAQNTTALSSNEADGLSKRLTAQKVAENTYNKAKERATAIGTGRVLSEGQQWKTTGMMEQQITQAGFGLEGEERVSAMTAEGKRLGLTDRGAKAMVSAMELHSWEQMAPAHAGMFTKDAGLLEILRNTPDSGWQDAMIANDPRVLGDLREETLAIDDPVDDTGVDFEQLAEEAATVEDQAKAGKDKSTLPNRVPSWTPKQKEKIQSIETNVGAKVSFNDRMKAIQEEIAEKKNKLDAKGDGQTGFWREIYNGSEVLNIPSIDTSSERLPSNVSDDTVRQYIARNNAAQFVLATFKGAAEAADLARENGASEDEQQWASDLIMSNLLRPDDQDGYMSMRDADPAAASHYLESTLAANMVGTEVDMVRENASRIDVDNNWLNSTTVPVLPDGSVTKGTPLDAMDPQARDKTYAVNDYGAFEWLGDLLKGKESNAEAITEELDLQSGEYSRKDYGQQAFADRESITLYGQAVETLSGERETGEKYVTDILLGEVKAMFPKAVRNGDVEKYSAVMDQIRADASGREGGFLSNGMAALAALGGRGGSGNSIDRTGIQELFDQHMGAGAYEEYRNSLPNSLKSTIENDVQAILDSEREKIQGKMNPEHPDRVQIDPLQGQIEALDISDAARDLLSSAVSLGHRNEITQLIAEAGLRTDIAEFDWTGELRSVLGDEAIGELSRE